MSTKTLWMFVGTLLLAGGCATVQVQAPKEPIKMDISMRLDVYQHVVKDIDDIESIVSGGKQTAWLGNLFIGTAYAAEGGLAPEATEAAYRRRDRKAALDGYLAGGALSEGGDALVTIGGSADGAARQLAQDENADRMVIYRAIAAKNGSSVAEVQKVYAERLRKS